MTKSLSRLIAALGICAVSVALAACGGDDSSDSTTPSGGGSDTAASAKPATVKVSYVAYTGAAALELGVQKGFFKQQKLDVKTSQGVAPAPIMAEVVAGKLDIGFTTIPALIGAVANGAPLQIVSGFDGYMDPDNPATAILVKDDSPITRPKDLVGKKVGVVALQSELDVLLHEVVDRDGGDASKVKSVQVPFPEMNDALKAGRVDAVVNTEPFVTLAKEQGVKEISSPEKEVVPNGTVTALVSTKEYISSHADVIKRFQTAMNRSLTYAQAHEDEAKQTMVKVADMEPELLDKINLGTVFKPGIDKSTIDKFAELDKKFGFVKNPPSSAELVAPGV